MFYAKTPWTLWALFIIFALFTVFSCVMGALFLFGVIISANGRPGYEAGIPLTLIGILFCTPLALTTFVELFHSRKPAIQLFSEGLKVRIVNQSVPDFLLDCVSVFGSIATPLLAIWRLITLKAFHVAEYYLNWEDVESIECIGNQLVIYWHWEKMDFEDDLIYSSFREGFFIFPVNQVGEYIRAFHDNQEMREVLEIWDK